MSRSIANRYPTRDRRPPPSWFMSAKSTKINITTGDDPTLTDAMRSSPEEREAWLNAIDEEWKSIKENGTWIEDDEPQGVPLPTHVVLNIKRNSERQVDRFKARIVAGGNHQTYGVDYIETYAPVIDFSLVRMFLCLLLSLDLSVAQVDIKTAFLNGILEDNIWVISPRGIPGVKSRV